MQIGDMVATFDIDSGEQTYVLGIIVEMVSTHGGLSGYRPKTFYTIEWADPLKPRSELIDTLTVLHYRRIYEQAQERGSL